MNVAIIMPTLNRPAQLKRNLENMLLQELPPSVHKLIVILAIQKSDTQSYAVASRLAKLWADSDTEIIVVQRENGTTCVQGFNVGYEFARGLADWYVLGSDDQIYTEGWLREALDIAKITGAQVIGLNDLHTDLGNYAPHYMVTGGFVEYHMGGHFVPPDYQTWWFDREICGRAQALGLYAPAYRALVEHKHPDWGTADEDDTYREASHARDADRELYEKRRRLYA